MAAMKRPDGIRGAALVEVLIAATFSAVLLGTTYSWARAAVASVRSGDRESRTARALAVALEEMAIDVRAAGCALGATPIGAIETARAHELVLTADFDGDGQTTGSNERIVYRFDAAAGLLRRGVGAGGAQPYVDGLADDEVRFRYFASGGSEFVTGSVGLTSPQRAAVALVRVSVAARATEREWMGLSIALRNPG